MSSGPPPPRRGDDADVGDWLPLRELAAMAYVGTWQALARLMWGALAIIVAYAAVAAFLVQSWWAVLPSTCVLLLLYYTTVLIPLVIARERWWGHRLLVLRSAAGGAVVVVVVKADAPGAPYRVLRNVLGLPAPGAPQLEDRAQRPGAVLLKRVVREARRHDVSVRLKATNRDVARKVYEPAGFVYASPEQEVANRPEMHLP